MSIHTIYDEYSYQFDNEIILLEHESPLIAHSLAPVKCDKQIYLLLA